MIVLFLTREREISLVYRINCNGRKQHIYAHSILLAAVVVVVVIGSVNTFHRSDNRFAHATVSDQHPSTAMLWRLLISLLVVTRSSIVDTTEGKRPAAEREPVMHETQNRS